MERLKVSSADGVLKGRDAVVIGVIEGALVVAIGDWEGVWQITDIRHVSKSSFFNLDH